jgi:hypothetical protein
LSTATNFVVLCRGTSFIDFSKSTIPLVARMVAVCVCRAPRHDQQFGHASLLPTYTPTGTVPTLAVRTFTALSRHLSAGNGWANAQDTGGTFAPISGCSYPDPWSGVGAPVPSMGFVAGGGGGAATVAAAGVITPAAA